ncbi:hypothetical protein DESUT3_27200 [Desulfuromonas versatilis]|uniref:histidine kinase n=1 Tax=Desulfuromonas versatilis TaxID=2802975 RepID=A0ABN6E3C2_9BACT|nr:histidine kinase [Desulfuromonas versatilis]BCR05651.1 hypothetical protein DESUT3_27200 [Desulfuromonas versatilis]
MRERDLGFIEEGHRFRMVRYFSIASLLCILAAALLLVFIFRKVTIDTIVEVSERGNLPLAQASLNSVRPQLTGYLDSVQGMTAAQAGALETDDPLRHALQALMKNSRLARIKLYNDQGLVVFSTLPSQIGHDQKDNAGFLSAMSGQEVSKLIYRDSFNYLDNESEEDNLIQSYVPVWDDQASQVLGVFEIYTGVDTLVQRTERASMLVGAGVGLVLILLYSLLVAIVRRANWIIEGQQALIRERTMTLEILSAQMLTAQEEEKKRIARDLHEGISQTLSAVKTQVELACQGSHKDDPALGMKPLLALVPSIQGAIQEISDFAMALRPASLDDFGLLATLDWWCREFQAGHPDLKIASRFDIEEKQIPAGLKVVIYRIIQETLGALAKEQRATRVWLSLVFRNGQVMLGIEDDGKPSGAAGEPAGQGSPADVGLALIKERARLSGGSFRHTPNDQGGVLRQAAWPC